ncbi:hypothetical protein PO909_000156 [Leuciscus waleckii]
MPPKTRQDRGAGVDEQLGMDQELPSSTELQETAGPTEGSVSELAGLVKVLLQSQAARDDRMEQVMVKQDQRWRNMQHQFQQIQHQVIQIQAGGDHRDSQVAFTAASPVPTGEGTSSGSIEPRLHPLTRDDDIEQFLTTFERMATACRWPQANWAIRLVPLLTGKARGAYVAMDGNDAEVYDKVKEAILMKYQINAEIYRQRFRSSEILPDENPRELYVRLKDLFSKWVKPETCTIQQLSELIILEQFMRMISSDMAVWIKEHDPATAEEAAKLAETYLAARQEAQHSFGGPSQRWPIQPCYAVTRAQSAIADLNEMPFAGVDFEIAVEKRRTSKKERRKRKFEGSVKEQVEELPLPECPLNMTIPEDIAEVQKNDPTLQDWFQKVSVVDGVRKEVGSCLMDEKYIVKKGILYQVRGPLDLLKEQWEGPKDGMCSVVQYVVQMRERLEEMTSLAQENIKKAQQTQKVWYDKRARERSFEPGQKVLLLLPTNENKLLAKWHGPYEVLRKTGRVTYEISMPERAP